MVLGSSAASTSWPCERCRCSDALPCAVLAFYSPDPAPVPQSQVRISPAYLPAYPAAQTKGANRGSSAAQAASLKDHSPESRSCTHSKKIAHSLKRSVTQSLTLLLTRSLALFELHSSCSCPCDYALQLCLPLSVALTLSLSVACRLQTGWLPLLPLVVWRLLPAARPPSPLSRTPSSDYPILAKCLMH